MPVIKLDDASTMQLIGPHRTGRACWLGAGALPLFDNLTLDHHFDKDRFPPCNLQTRLKPELGLSERPYENARHDSFRDNWTRLCVARQPADESTATRQDLAATHDDIIAPRNVCDS